MDKLDKLKLASSSLGERLKMSGAQMSRIVSMKMKGILQSPTPESKMVDEATSEAMEEPNWGLNLRICAMINNEEFNGTEIVKAIKKKLLGRSAVSQRLSLDLLETCTSNCEKVFSEVASEKVLDDMVRMIDDPKTEHDNRVKAMQLIRAWGESEDLTYLPVFHQTYTKCKQSLPVVQRIIENTSNDDILLFEALNLNDELQQVICRYEEMEATVAPGGLTKSSDLAGEPPSGSATKDTKLSVEVASHCDSMNLETVHSGHDVNAVSSSCEGASSKTIGN